jgi:glutathione S-transferase
MTMKLYGTDTSPFVRKVRLVALEKGLACEYIIAAPGGAGSPVPALNPLGLIPVLVRDDGVALFDSPVIAEYLDSLKTPTLIPTAGEPRWQALRWSALADGMQDQAVARVYETRRPPAQQSSESIRGREEKIARAFEFAEAHAGTAEFLVDGRLTIADIAMVCALEYIDFRYPHGWRDRCPRLTAWYNRMRERATFAQTRPA